MKLKGISIMSCNVKGSEWKGAVAHREHAIENTEGGALCECLCL